MCRPSLCGLVISFVSMVASFCVDGENPPAAKKSPPGEALRAAMAPARDVIQRKKDIPLGDQGPVAEQILIEQRGGT